MTGPNTQTGLIRKFALFILFVLLMTACDREELSHEEIVMADLSVIIHSLGSPCEKVLEYESTGDLGYLVHCQSGDEYHISVNPKGRVDLKSRE